MNSIVCARPTNRLLSSSVEIYAGGFEIQTPPYHLICCRNLAFTYFDMPLQQEIVQRLQPSLVDEGVLLIGVHESLPPESAGLAHGQNAWASIYVNDD